MDGWMHQSLRNRAGTRACVCCLNVRLQSEMQGAADGSRVAPAMQSLQ
jgi:hypothetical protein